MAFKTVVTNEIRMKIWKWVSKQPALCMDHCGVSITSIHTAYCMAASVRSALGSLRGRALAYKRAGFKGDAEVRVVLDFLTYLGIEAIPASTLASPPGRLPPPRVSHITKA